MFFGEKRERGQILLVVILAAVVALTVGLAAVSRTVTNTKVTTEEQNSQKALSAAEAGVEEITNNAAYGASGTGTKTLSNNSTFTSQAVASSPVSPFAVNNGDSISKDDGADIWLSKYPDYSLPWSGTMTVYWQKNSSDCTKEAAVEIVVLSGASTSTPSMNRYAVDGCSSRKTSNGFTAASASSVTISGITYSNSYTLPAIASGFIARVIPLYSDTKVAVSYTTSGANPFPSQGSVITSTGASGDTKRTIQVVKGYPRVPIEFFPYNVFLPE